MINGRKQNMIDRIDFIEKITYLFDETDPSEITIDTEFKNLDEWSSLVAMGLVATITDEYNVSVTVSEIQKLVTFEDVAKFVDEKMQSV